MNISADRVLETLENTLADLKEDPIDLLNINDQHGECTYLENAKHSYQRTLLNVTTALHKQGEKNRPIKVLEIGAFLGVVSVALAALDLQVTALDIPEFVMNERLQQRYRQAGVTAVAANLRDCLLPLETEQFDIVIMCETLEHLNFNPLPVVAEVNRVLRADGLLYLALPNLASLPHRFDLLRGRSIHNPIDDFVQQLSSQANMIVGLHWREYTRAELLEMFSLTGFQCENHSYDMPERACLPAKLLYRLFPSLRPAQCLLARKTGKHKMNFHYTAATRG